MLTSTMALPVVSSSTQRLKDILRERPLYISIETTNICNARCVFCAYPKMTRAKTVMSPELFEKIISDYIDMGGGAVGLTPIVGDVLVDPHLPDRLALLRNEEAITHVAFTTNAIAWGRFSERNQRLILESVDCISISLGGLDPLSYNTMFAVDRFDKVCEAIESMCRIKSAHGLGVELHLLFRVNRPADELIADERMAFFRRPEITNITSLNNFGNWGGLIGSEDLPEGAQLIQVDLSPQRIREKKKHPCFVHYLSPEITCTGLVSACGCMNAEAGALILGDVTQKHLGEIWQGDTRKRLLAAYGTDALPEICKRCSYYADGEAFIAKASLASFRVGDNPWDVLRRNPAPPPVELLSATLAPLRANGYTRIALYGAGRFTRLALSGLDATVGGQGLVAIIDDNPKLVGTTVAGLPVYARHEATAIQLDAVILASNHHAQAMWDASASLRQVGIHVAKLAQHQG